MEGPGEKPESRIGPDPRALIGELQRLRKAGLSDLALRPSRYLALSTIFANRSDDTARDMLGLLARNARVFDAVLAELPTPELRRAAEVLFHSRRTGSMPSLVDRRKAADRIITQREYAREPDTIQRFVEHDLLDPLLVEILCRPSRIATPQTLQLDYDSWSDDLDRAIIYLDHQEVSFAGKLLDRWLVWGELSQLDDVGKYLRARSLVLNGNMQSNQGRVIGPLSARKSYDQALSIYSGLGNNRRSAQVELLIAVTDEMSGQLDSAVVAYRALAKDERLNGLDRGRAQLWVGTALTKQREIEEAVKVMESASNLFERLDEPDDWVMAHQKLALGHLHEACRYIDFALSYRGADSPLRRVQIGTAHGHILSADPATREDGLTALQEAEQLASRYSLMHQVDSIKRIRRTVQSPNPGSPVAERH